MNLKRSEIAFEGCGLTPDADGQRAVGQRDKRPTGTTNAHISRNNLSTTELRPLLLQALANLTMGLEQEVFNVGANGALVDLSERYRTLSYLAKSVTPPRLGRNIRGPVTEGGDAIREFITEPFSPTPQTLSATLEALKERIETRFAIYGLTPLYASLPLLVSGENGMGITRHRRYETDRERDPQGIDHATRTASLQINIGTVPKQIRALLVGMMGDSAHEFLAVSASSPFSWTRYDKGTLYKWSGDNATDKDAYLVDTGWASNRSYVRDRLKTVRQAPVAYNQEEYDEGRTNNLIQAGLDPTIANHSRDHALVRITEFGEEIRSPDSPPTIEERELLCILAIGAHIRNIQRLAADPMVLQAEPDKRDEATRLAIEHGLSGTLIDAETRRTGNAFGVLRSRLKRMKPGLDAFERGDFEAVLDNRERNMPDLHSAQDSFYGRGMRILERIQEIGSAAERQRRTLTLYREQGEIPPSFTDKAFTDKAFTDKAFTDKAFTDKAYRIVSRDEALFLHSYLIAEQRLGLFAEPDQTFATALAVKAAAELQLLRPELPEVTVHRWKEEQTPRM